jgi:hypothetical protein
VSIRWRLGLLLFQVVLLVLLSLFVTGQAVVNSRWYLAGLLAIVVNPALLEPWYSRPQDVLVNSLIGLGLVVTADPAPETTPGWRILMGVLILLGVLALLALALGAGRDEGPGVGIARAAYALSRQGTSVAIYSAVFWLSAYDFAGELNSEFWKLAGGWLLLVAVGRTNWQAAWASVSGQAMPGSPQGMIGPSILLVAGSQLPVAGTRVQIVGSDNTTGTVVTRIQRASDAWAEVFIDDAEACHRLVQQTSVSLEPLSIGEETGFVGAVDAGSTNRSVQFVAVRQMSVGDVVMVRHGAREILYQISNAEVERSNIRGGAHLVVRARGAQLGEFDPSRLRIRRHAWVPQPGAAVFETAGHRGETADPPASWFELGTVIGTDIPVYLDVEQVCQGHLVILGMTRMGKTTLAVRIAEALAARYRVTLVDQTGEYVGKRGFPSWKEKHEDSQGLSVWEPKPGEVSADRTLNYLEWLVEKAVGEYRVGDPPQRVVILEEAHQFVPEPAGLGFNAPGRDSAYRFGSLMMQARKYGISIILISQRTAVVAKSALSQCENVIAFKSVDKTGLDYLESLAGIDARDLLPTLEQGQALVFGPGFSTDAPVALTTPNV